MAVYKEEKTNTWRVLYRYTDWNGERKQSQKRGFKTKREAQAWEREQLNKLGGDLDMTFKSFVQHYTEDMQARIKENTWATKEHIIQTKLIPYFGKLKMCNITAQQIITWQNELINYKDDNGKATVLYFALEDDYPRLQRRLYHMFGADGTDNLYFATQCKTVNGGLEDQIRGFIQEHPDTGLIIIDTLKRVRETGGADYSYGSDYDVVAKLKSLADSYKVTMLIVHHTRKQQADDKFDTISGTNGLLGAADGAFVLNKEKRTANAATLDITGRDQQDQRIHLVRDPQRLVWEFEKSETELWVEPPDPLLEKVSTVLSSDSSRWDGTASELSKLIGLDTPDKERM